MSKIKRMKIKEITPSSLFCGVGACTSVFETEKETFLIIGKKLDSGDIPNEVRKKIGNDEMIIEVPKELITELDLFKKE